MQEDKLLPHVENLVPGFVTLLVLADMGVSSLRAAQYLGDHKSPGEQVIVALVVAAAAYQIGVVVFTASRLVVDTLSKLTFRWMLLAVFEPRQFLPLRGKGWKNLRAWPRRINDEYRTTVKNALCGAKQHDRGEVVKRRERGRLVRTAVLPSIYVGYLSWGESGFFIGAVAVVFFYAYAEVGLYKEARLAT